MSKLMDYSIDTLNRLSDKFLFEITGELKHEYTANTVSLANRVLSVRGVNK